jgi:hypothetical protein
LTTTELNIVQQKMCDDLLALGGSRPTAPPDIAARLEDHLNSSLRPILSHWTEKKFWITKGQLLSIHNCEGFVKADFGAPRAHKMFLATAVGQVAHLAIQLSYTHPGLPPETYVKNAITAQLEKKDFQTFWTQAPISVQSDLIITATSKVVGFLDTWPPLRPSWTPRFEETVQAKLESLTMSCRMDLIIGRPKLNNVMSMLLCDLKSGSLSDYHENEADFYALVATLRFRVPPWRSIVFSLASNTYTTPDVTEERLFAAADYVISGVSSLVYVLSDIREPELTPGNYCAWCPARSSCPVSQAPPDKPVDEKESIPEDILNEFENF